MPLSRRDLGKIALAAIPAAGALGAAYINSKIQGVRIGVQSAIAHPETSALLRKLMLERNLPVPPEGRTLTSICITDLCK